MDTAIEHGARSAATRLSEQLGPDLPMHVETELHRDPNEAPHQYVDPISISIGALIVSIAGLAWTIYQDLSKPGRPQPTPPVVSRTVRIQLSDRSDLSHEERAHVIDVTVEEVLRHASTTD